MMNNFQLMSQFSIFKRLKIEHSGFTLLEMTLAVGIFAVLVVSTLGIMITVSNAQIKVGNIQAVQDNIRFGVELMTKELRTGINYQLTISCVDTPGQEITFLTSHNELRTYYLDPTTQSIMRSNTPIASRTDCDTANGNVSPLTSEEVTVERLTFLLHGEIAGPQDGQPMVTISMKVSSRGARYGAETNMNIQTTVEQRLRDL